MSVNKLFYKDDVIDPAGYILQSSESAPGRITVTYAQENKLVPNYTVDFSVDHEGVHVGFYALPECRAEFSGFITWGDQPRQHTFPMSSIENSYHLRSAIGPAASYIDNMLFDRLTDSAVSVIGGKRFRMRYDWNEKTYGFSLITGIKPEERKFRVSALWIGYTNDPGENKFVRENPEIVLKRIQAGVEPTSTT